MANQIMTIVEAHVPAERWAELSERFAQLQAQRPPQIIQSYLLQSAADPTLWRMIGLWPSQQVFDEYRTSVPVPGAAQLFLSVGAQPALMLFEVKG